MAQITQTVAQGILDGQGYTDNEVRQLAHFWLSARAPADSVTAPASGVVVQPSCPGIPRPGCNYLAQCESVCNKCGKLHSTRFLEDSQPVAAARRWSTYEQAIADPIFQTARSIMGTENIGQDRQLVKAINHVIDSTPPAQAADSVTAPAGGPNTKTAELLSTTVGLLMGYREGGARQPYKPGSVIAKTVDEVVEHLKNWPYPEPAPPTPPAQEDSVHAPVLLSDEELCQIEEPYLLNFRIPLGGQYDFARAVEKAVLAKTYGTQAPNPTPPAQAADSVLEDAALSSEQQRAILEAYESAASESYFEVRPQIDCSDRRRVFKAGYERGWDAARKQGGAT